MCFLPSLVYDASANTLLYSRPKFPFILASHPAERAFFFFLTKLNCVCVYICSVREQQVLSAIFFYYYISLLSSSLAFFLTLKTTRRAQLLQSGPVLLRHLGEGSPFIRQSRDILVRIRKGSYAAGS